MITAAFLNDLKKNIAAENIVTDAQQCAHYNRDAGRHVGHAEIVIFATAVAEIQTIIKLCRQHKVILTTRGGGTGTPGGAVPEHGGVVLSLERMNKIISVDPANRCMVVEAGVTNQAVQDAAASHGFFWPPDPGSAINCTIGGNLACNAAGPHTVKYGSTRDNVLGLQAITGAGEIISAGTYTTKGAVGYDLTRLLIGSEGTLAIITQATLKLTPLPETKQTLQAIYADIESATQAVTQIMAQPLIPCALEFIDATAIELLRQQGIVFPENAGAVLLIEVDGAKQFLPAIAKKISLAATNNGLLQIYVAENPQQEQQLWKARKSLSLALRAIAPAKISEDVVVPVAQIPQLVNYLQQLALRYQIKIVNYGHAGNGNLHVNLLVDSNDELQMQQAKLCLAEVFAYVIQLKGTLSGEHGIGIEKREYLPQAVGKAELNIMRQIKHIFDPDNILNPGKIFLD